MGRIVAPFGIQGWVRVQPYTAAPGGLLDYPVWQVGGAAGRMFAVTEGRVHGNALVAHLQGIDDRDAAAALRGSDIVVARSELPPATENEYYWADLIGLAVVSQEGVEFGKVAELVETGANDVLVVQGERERLIPFVEEYVKVVDLAGGTITVAWQADW